MSTLGPFPLPEPLAPRLPVGLLVRLAVRRLLILVVSPAGEVPQPVQHVLSIAAPFATKERRCRWHKIGNVLAALPKSARKDARAALAEIHNAEDRSTHLVALVRAGAKFENGVLVERPDESTSGDTHAA